jgi:hypothetical protein
MKNLILTNLIIFLVTVHGFSQSIDFHGQISGWITVNGKQVDKSQLGLRYLPELLLEKSLTRALTISADISLNSYGSGQFNGWNKFDANGRIKPYRLWLRFASSQFESRIGLQKINFGSAALLRPLMWFDRIDPRDPLQLTDGVYALLLRYYFLNNTNIWLWGLYGNDETKGWEIIPSDQKKIEFGGRWQMPIYKGEFAITYHHRQADLKRGLLGQIPLGDESIPEDRFGLDGKWDIGIGVWFEATITHQQIDLPAVKYQRLLNLGLDYTFGVGNGMHAMLENFIYETADKIFSVGESVNFSALSLGYPIGLLDQINGMIYHDWKNKTWYRFINWQRTYNRWQLFLIGFWNPDQFQIYRNQVGENLFAGKGMQIMMVFNH